MSLSSGVIGTLDIADQNGISRGYGKRLLPSVLDQWARDEPERLYALIPHADDVDQGFDGVTMLQMSRAIDATAWWLTEAFGTTEESQVLAYIGISDLRFPIVHLAAMKLGWKLVLLAARNAVSQNLRILERSDCTNLLYGPEIKSNFEDLSSSAIPLNCVGFVSFQDLLAIQTQTFPYERDFFQLEHEPALVIHSSGTTGEPKLVTMTHGTFSATDLDRSTPTPPGRRAQNASLFAFASGGKAYSCFPPYHLAGVQAFTLLPIFYGLTAVFGPSSVPANGQLLNKIMQQIQLNAVYIPPAIIESWIRLPGALEQAAKLDFVLYGGGPLSAESGNMLDEVCNLCQVYGSAEIGQVQMLVPLKGNWSHLEINPCENIDMQLSEEHGAYEMVIHQDPTRNFRRSLYHNFPNIETWRTGDLFLPHPTKPGLWDFYGRVDDLIVLSNGHKVNPVAMETHVQGHPCIQGALVIGTGRTNPAIILEIAGEANRSSKDERLEVIWPMIETLNKSLPGHGQILRSMVLISDAQKPFIRASKGSIVRKSTLDCYTKEIDDLYSGRGVSKSLGFDTIEDMVFGSLRQFVRRCINSLLPSVAVTDTDNLFDSGLDSLKIIELRNAILNSFCDQGFYSRSALTLETIYGHPTVSDLARAIHSIMVQNPHYTKSYISHPQSLISKYTCDLQAELSSESGLNVLLTGSTGTLGMQVLRTLLKNPRISTIYCLGRHPHGREDQALKFRACKYEAEIDMSKARFLCIDLSEERLGLTCKVWRELASAIQLIFHTAWTVDFNLPLSHFESHHIRGLRSLIDLSRDGRHRPRIVFTSSTSAMSNWQSVHGPTPVPERLADEHETAFQMGYGLSKFVAERMLGFANDHCGIPVTIFRIGQIAGPVCDPPEGQWPQDEFVPLLARTSKCIRLLPSLGSYCDWIPLDMVVQIMHEILFPPVHVDSNMGPSHSESEAVVYNLVNPNHTHWSLLNDRLQRHLGEDVQIVPLSTWVKALKENTANVESMPALKILSFLESLSMDDYENKTQCLSFETAKGIRDSGTMARLQPVTADWIDIWIKQWNI